MNSFKDKEIGEEHDFIFLFLQFQEIVEQNFLSYFNGIHNLLNTYRCFNVLIYLFHKNFLKCFHYLYFILLE